MKKLGEKVGMAIKHGWPRGWLPWLSFDSILTNLDGRFSLCVLVRYVDVDRPLRLNAVPFIYR
jgi:hypothetical protein